MRELMRGREKVFKAPLSLQKRYVFVQIRHVLMGCGRIILIKLWFRICLVIFKQSVSLKNRNNVALKVTTY